jgi:hypothetical protein
MQFEPVESAGSFRNVLVFGHDATWRCKLAPRAEVHDIRCLAVKRPRHILTEKTRVTALPVLPGCKLRACARPEAGC